MKNMTIFNLISLAVLGLSTIAGLSACAPPNLSADIVNGQSSYTYNLSENGCSTGEQQFSGREAMCDGLKNEPLNNYCAQNLRRSKFQTDCPERTW